MKIDRIGWEAARQLRVQHGLGWAKVRFTKKIVERGNVTLPSDIREALGIEDGDFVEFEIVGILKRNSTVDPRHLDQLPLQRPRNQMRVVAPASLGPDGQPAPSSPKRPPPEAPR